MTDFEIVRQLGKGAYGVVVQVSNLSNHTNLSLWEDGTGKIYFVAPFRSPYHSVLSIYYYSLLFAPFLHRIGTT